MNSFKQTVVIIAIIILILCLTFSAIALHNQKEGCLSPIVASCPDYWVEDENGTCTPGPNFLNANLQPSCKSLNSKKHEQMRQTSLG